MERVIQMSSGVSWVKPRHQIIHDIIIGPVRLLFRVMYHFRGSRSALRRGSGPYLILANHTTPLDPVCLGSSFDFPIYYVASDHIFRLGWISRLLVWLVAPIPIVKSRVDLQTIKDMMTVVKQGGSVCLFPEGNRSFNGETVAFSASTAKLARKLGVPVVLYRFEGGYLTAPRWADTVRRGRMTGWVVRVISVAEMQGMTAEQLHEQINRELSVNAFDAQLEAPVRYRGKRLAEALERFLYLCPNCNGMATLKSNGDVLSCGCGLSARYTGTGFLEPAGMAAQPFKTVLDWDRWQKRALQQWLGKRLDTANNSPLLQDDGMSLYTCGRAGENTLAGRGRLVLHRDRFVFEDGHNSQSFPLAGIVRVIIHGKQALQFTDASGVTYEVKTDRPWSALKYMNVVILLQNNGEVPDGFFSL